MIHPSRDLRPTHKNFSLGVRNLAVNCAQSNVVADDLILF